MRARDSGLTPTLMRIVDAKGIEWIFENTGVDDITQSALYNFFELDRLCCHSAIKWRWMWRRNLALYYPIYKQELEMWSEYRSLEWLYDKDKVNQKLHTEISKTGEVTKEVEKEERTGSRTQDTTGRGESSGTGSSTSHQDGNGTSNSSDDTTTDTTGKERAFSFNYPEANYQGGVIPYDIENNPSVEFISNQADRINKSNTVTHTEGTSGYENESNGKDTSEYSDNWESSGSLDEGTKSNTDATKDGTRDSKNELIYHDRYDYDGNNIVDLADKIINMLPNANFFKKFVDKMSICFSQNYDTDRIELESDVDWDG